MQEVSTKPYLLRAIYEWCTDNGFTPHIVVAVDHRTRVPMGFVKNGEIVLNISFEATSGLKMDNDMVRFSARFGGVPHDIRVPVENVLAIYAQENGQGMAFEVVRAESGDAQELDDEVIEPAHVAPVLSAVPTDADEQDAQDTAEKNDDQKKNEKKSSKPILKLVK